MIEEYNCRLFQFCFSRVVDISEVNVDNFDINDYQDILNEQGGIFH